MVFLCPSCCWFASGACADFGLAAIFITDLCRMALGELSFASRLWKAEQAYQEPRTILHKAVAILLLCYDSFLGKENMKKLASRHGLPCMLCLVLIPALIAIKRVRADEEDFSAAGYNRLRVEQETKLLVPSDRAEEVWKFLHGRYVMDSAALKELDPLFASYGTEEQFTDTYFDTPDLKLLAMESGVRHRRRINLTNPDDRKSGRELMQIKLNDISRNVLERGEIKFEIKRPANKQSPEDNHPMLGMVKSSQREGFKQRLKEIGLEPFSMKPVLTVHDLRKRIYVTRDKKPFLSVSFDTASSGIWWATTTFVEIEPELNEIVFTEADPETKQYMETILHKITQEIQQRFPFIKSNLTPKYNKSFYNLEAQLPFLRFLVRWNLHPLQTVLALLFIAAFIIVAGAYCITYQLRQGKA